MENTELQPQKKTIAVIASNTHSLLTFRLDMMKSFIVQGYNVVAAGDEPEDKWVEEFNKYGIKYRQIYVNRTGLNFIQDYKTVLSIRKFAEIEKPDKLFCFLAKTVAYTGIALRKNKTIEVYPLIAGLGSIFRATSLKTKLVRIIMAPLYKRTLKRSKAVIFQNKDDLQVLVDRKIVKKDKCQIVNGSGVNLEQFKVTPLPDKTSFVMIGRLIKDKGLVEYLDACREIKKANPDVKCMLVGPFDTNPSAITKEELEERISDGSVEYVGKQDDVRPFIEKASVFVLPSHHEGTPKTILESMAQGRAILTTDAPGCRETVVDGENGYLVPVYDVKALIEKMQYFIDSPEVVAKMGKRSREIVEDKYDVNKVNQSISKIMNL